MKPGRELDALVAEKVMGLQVKHLPPQEGLTRHEEFTRQCLNFEYQRDIPHYSTDIAAAWMVVEKLHALGFSYCIEQTENSEKPTVWLVKRGVQEEFTVARDNAEMISESSEGLPHAICLAALKAVGVEV